MTNLVFRNLKIDWTLVIGHLKLLAGLKIMNYKDNDLMNKVISLCKRRGFIFPGSEIYGGLANSWDYGPLGVELKNNIRSEWWKWFVHRRADMVGIDPAIIMNPKVWEASGHLKEFSDPLVECKSCHQRFREDLVKEAKEKPTGGFYDDWSGVGERDKFLLVCPKGGDHDWTTPKQFNLLFKTFIGPSEDSTTEAYLRGELAQAMFVNFPNVLQTTRMRLPFGIAAQGKVFRNEITPGNFIFRTREFDLMEFEYFVVEKEWEQWFEYWRKEMHRWLKHLGVSEKHIHDHDIPKDELAHYSKRTIDIEYDYPFGRKELYGLAYRTDFDLKNHMEKSGQDMRYTDSDTGEKFIPHVVEPTFGLDRSVLVALLEAYHEEQAPTARSAGTSAVSSVPNGSGQAEEGETDLRVVMKFPKWLAPIQIAILPLSKNEKLSPGAKAVAMTLTNHFKVEYDETQSIGKRYRRQDEIGTAYCVTYDFESNDDKKVTVRDRDTMKQERVKISELTDYLGDKF